MAAIVACAVYSYKKLSDDPYRNLKEQEGHAIEGLRIAQNYQWAHKKPTAQELKAAFNQLDDELKKNPHNTVALSAKIHLGLEHDPAISAVACDRVLQRSPNNYFALVHGSRAYLALTNLNRGAYYAAKAVHVQDCPEARLLLGDALYAQRNTNAARKQYEQALAMNPADEVAQTRLRELQAPR